MTSSTYLTQTARYPELLQEKNVKDRRPEGQEGRNGREGRGGREEGKGVSDEASSIRKGKGGRACSA